MLISCQTTLIFSFAQNCSAVCCLGQNQQVFATSIATHAHTHAHTITHARTHTHTRTHTYSLQSQARRMLRPTRLFPWLLKSPRQLSTAVIALLILIVCRHLLKSSCICMYIHIYTRVCNCSAQTLLCTAWLGYSIAQFTQYCFAFLFLFHIKAGR